jgi:hypothetical protein
MSNIQRTNFSLSGNVFSLFGLKGKNDDGNWFLKRPGFSEAPWREVEPDIMSYITSLEIDKKPLSDAVVELNQMLGVILFLEGTITEENLTRADEGEGYVDIPDVTIGGFTSGERAVTVRIIPEAFD